MENFRVIIVEDVPLELKGTEGIFRNEIPEAEIIGTAESEVAYWKLIKQNLPDLVLLDLGLSRNLPPNKTDLSTCKGADLYG